MSTSKMQMKALAKQLWDAKTNQRACAPLTDSCPELSIAEAYAISADNFAAELEASKCRKVGRKIGLTSKAVQLMVGVEEPDFGYLHSGMLIKNGGQLPTEKLLSARVESEIAFILREPLQGPNVTAKQVFEATDYILPVLEIIDCRVADWKIKIQDTVADNACAAYFVLGDKPVKLTPDLDLRLKGMTLRLDDEVSSTGCGAACLSHPFWAVAWLANTLSEMSETLERGEIILSGALGPTVPVQKGVHCSASISGIGDVHVIF